jgi:DNA-binding SARP family transcriptional activator
VIDFRLLGPLEASLEGRAVTLPAGKPSALLARLLLDTNRVVAAEVLIQALWDDAPASAHKLLQGYVSRLRKVLGREHIETRPPGYVLHVARDKIDMGRFEQLLDAARATTSTAERAELLRTGLTLWRGPALVEFRQEPFAPRAGRRLAELRLNALERRIEAELELGEHARLVGELEALVAEEPLREPLRGALMLALYRSGRQAEALDRYREGRRLLVEQLGIEPAPALQDLERAILRQDPRLDDSGRSAEAPRGAVIGVGSELAPLLAPLCSDRRELVLVELAVNPGELSEGARRLDATRSSLADRAAVRTACFTSTRPAEDLARLAQEQGAELLVLAAPFEPSFVEELARAASCDVALAVQAALSGEWSAPVLVPFGGGRDEWAALELGAWFARARGVPLHLLGTQDAFGRRDASRMLAGASLALQRFMGIAAEPVLVRPGAEGILGEQGSAIVASLPPGELDETRRTLAERVRVPLLFVRGGLKPSGLAPDRTLTRFSWSLRDERPG